jgi:putative ABC transport system permease protein
MLDWDKWLEIFHTIIKNPLRTLLTGLSVALGIFILVVMQGLGFGLQNGVMKQIQDDAINSIWVRSGVTSIPYKGLNANRRIEYDNDDLAWVVENVEGVTDYSGRFMRWSSQISYGREKMDFGIRAVHPGHQMLERTDVKEGRYINTMDVTNMRKVALIGKTVYDDLFKGKPAVGEYIEINGISFRVIGMFEDPNSRWENRQVYVPISTGQKVFGGRDKLNMFMVSTGEASLEEMKNKIDLHLREHYSVHPEDERAVWLRNNNEEFKEFLDIFVGIRTFIWVIGFFTLFAGIIGVANIMSIIVKERTKEIGIRKALGATPWSIISLIIQESTFLTFVAGCFGLVVGVGLLELVSNFIDHEFFTNPTINYRISIGALLILVVAGSLSGLIPAIRAVNIRPVEALRDE